MSYGDPTVYRQHDRGQVDREGYPLVWRSVKHEVREHAGNRCIRCGHPYAKGAGEWSPCDERCEHAGPRRWLNRMGDWTTVPLNLDEGCEIQAHWRILTVHHADGDKCNLRWWNLLSLCQRCHLQIQGRVVMDRVWPHEHSAWFKPYVAGYYAWRYLGESVGREDAAARMDGLLALESRQLSFGVGA